MKDKMLEESLNNFYRTFLIWVIRCYPILFCLAILVHQCEVVHSVGTGDIIEYYDGDTLEYIQYATPFSDKYLTIFFNAKLFNAILFYVLSKVFLFCINAIYSTSIGFVTVGFFIALYLHQRSGDRKVHTHQTISDGYRCCNKQSIFYP